ncbi:glycosyl hydrolase family 61-domain-containing protein [Xylaria sp. FL1042]|nr:glycosyl hydrolase family 61-domain-containing protein [Xylaria sp. FL1042]
MKFLPTLGLVTLLAGTAQSHVVFSTLFINGVSQGDGKCLRTSFTVDKITSPITDLESPDLACGIRKAFFRVPSLGKRIAARYYRCPKDPTGPGWFKLYDYGYDEESHTWAIQKLIANDGIVSVKIPKEMPKGQYLIRPEILALHNLAAGPTQFYTGCTQILVDGSSSKPLNIPQDKLVSIPGYIKPSDPAVNFNSHPDAVKKFPYILGGPKVYEFPGTEETTDIVFDPLDGAGPSSLSSPTATSTPVSTPEASSIPPSYGGANQSLPISCDGTCGTSGFTCLGSVYGNCCSPEAIVTPL